MKWHSPLVGYEAHCVGVVVGDLAAIHVLHVTGVGRGVAVAHGLVLLVLVLVARRRQVVRQEERRRGTLGRRVGGQRLVVKNLSKAQRKGPFTNDFSREGEGRGVPKF